jgi:hypothetical protein
MGGKTVLPLLSSFFRNLLSSRNCGLTSTSLRCGSQLSCRVSSSNCSSSFCSSVSFETQASLSNFEATAEDDLAFGEGFGAPKNAVMLPLGFGFFVASVAASAALRFRLISKAVSGGSIGGIEYENVVAQLDTMCSIYA